MNKKFVLGIQEIVLNIFQNYISIQRQVNTYVINNDDTKKPNISIISAQSAIARIIELLGKQQGLEKKCDSRIDFNMISSQLFQIGCRSRIDKTHRDESTWNLILGHVRIDGFIEVIRHLLKLIDDVQKDFVNINNTFQYTDLARIGEIEEMLNKLNSSLVLTLLYTQALIIIMTHIDEIDPPKFKQQKPKLYVVK